MKNINKLALYFVNSQHTGQWWSDCMTDADMLKYVQDYVFDNMDEFLNFAAGHGSWIKENTKPTSL